MILLILLTIHSSSILSQNFSEIKKEDLLKVSGSVGALSTYYNGPSERVPFFWQLQANLSITTPLLNIPISFVLNQQQRSFGYPKQPFNQYGLSPKYKAITLHLGYRTMRFSEFSLSGNQFFGLGLEVAPKDKKFKYKCLVGRFSKAIFGDTMDVILGAIPTFERRGWGNHLEFGSASNNISLLLFKAKDDANSISSLYDSSVVFKPAENLIFGATTKQKINKQLSFDTEIDWSAFTNNTRNPETVIPGFSYLNNLGSLFYANNTTTFNSAVSGNLKYTKKNLGLKLGYRRIAPEYKTMGSVYLNNDFEDLTSSLAYKLLKNKINLNITGGLQRNNLNSDKVTEMLRKIYALSANYLPNSKWNFNLQYSNFNASTQKTLVLVMDTSLVPLSIKNYAQVTESAALQVMYNKPSEKNILTSFLSSNYQNAKVSVDDTTTSDATFYNTSLGSSINWIKTKTSFSLLINANLNISESPNASTLGPSFVISKTFLKKPVNTNLSVSLLQSYIDNQPLGLVTTGNFSANYRHKEKHSFSLSLVLANRLKANKRETETITSLTYNYSF
tara:strand:- start:1425 stop:3107 length:1683 start_codon:yes stop_codon:yes gene_type:complete